MHKSLAIMCIAGNDYLLPIANFLQYKYVIIDFLLARWSQHDEFLLLVADAAVEWLVDIIPTCFENLSFTAILDKITLNNHISNFFFFVTFFYFNKTSAFVGLIGVLCKYVELRYVICNNDIKTVNCIWRQSFAIFHTTNKVKYAFLSIFVRFVTKYAHPAYHNILDNRLVALKGNANHHIEPDCVTEKINLEEKCVYNIRKTNQLKYFQDGYSPSRRAHHQHFF